MVQKIVITNSMYSFGLSKEAVDRLLELGYVPELPKYFDKKYPNKTGKEYEKDIVYWVGTKIDRTNSLLIQVVEEMGVNIGENCLGDNNPLCIVEIPDDVKWRIVSNDEFGGFEIIHEVHRTWGCKDDLGWK